MMLLSHGEPLPSGDTISLYQIILVRKYLLLNKDTSLILVVIPFISTLKYIHRSPKERSTAATKVAINYYYFPTNKVT